MLKISEPVQELILKLYDRGKGLAISDIAKRLNISYQTVYSLTQLVSRVNPDTEKPFESSSEYNQYLLERRTNPDTGKPFSSRSQYEKQMAALRINPETGEPFGSKVKYDDYLARQRINPETGEPFRSEADYASYRRSLRAQEPDSIRLSGFLRSRLAEMERSQSWLASRSGVTPRTISNYLSGKTVPNQKVLQKIFSVLKVPYRSIDDIADA